ncbi:sugar ABC transporter ATP-binding protein [Ralstonia solanacearum]|uniref:sugar ABC transporter ATP-binding protein n=1 Tax=Ralstonia solanacearum TaxID=305 RepID=UPI00018164CC|nr:sugar ABC transporter ATP-binding protein [Ralstonia solanacearum]MDC6176992.1 sugar ABC transporter ATP-binding protein [Ralstonia solanacearum]MDC6210993.1 sugar ABC transporter ATP-binding protein [Ralstonia solanacearum]MDC6240080.1 sugar ABC transporter ATP-binding protein [Ralstonia solanacearum]MDD7801622.1 sugar ABC transporter ATP-binding protein [Ralstonia solanacearum]
MPMTLSPLAPPPDTAVPAAARDALLHASGLCKAFAGVTALDNVGLSVHAGRVHALMGENGAGKSTMMKILSGVYLADRGALYKHGRPLQLRSPRDALRHGIAMIHQELNLLPDMTVAENIWIGREPRNPLGLVDHGELRRRTAQLLSRLEIHIDPDTELGDLSIASRQMIEIAKAVSCESDLLIMDEPTSAITDREVEHLFRIIAELKRAGKAIIYITHKMDEVFRIADDVSVLRDGRYVAGGPANGFDHAALITAMVGRELSEIYPKVDVAPGEVVLAVRGLTRRGVYRDVSFEVRAGEVLGVAGLMGSGRTEVMESLFGIVPADAGEVRLDGARVQLRHPGDAIARGMAFLTEDRKKSGAFLSLSVGCNMEISALGRHCTAGFVRQHEMTRKCEAMRRQLRIKTPSLDEAIENLSGGNQQKVLIARWLLNAPRVLILDEPTRGIDIGAKAEIYRLIGMLAQSGVAIIMVSSELPEVMGMSDRILVMHQGSVGGLLARPDFSQERIMALASGVRTFDL